MLEFVIGLAILLPCFSLLKICDVIIFVIYNFSFLESLMELKFQWCHLQLHGRM